MFGGTSSGGSGFSLGQSKPNTGFSFGGNTNNATNTNTTSGFGLSANKPSGGFSFGANGNANPGSSSMSQSGFGAKPATTSGFSFGNTANSNSNTTGTSLFGGGNNNNNNNNNAATGSGTTGFSFGGNSGPAANNNNSTTGTSGGLFGSKPATGATTGFAFGNNNNNTGNNNNNTTGSGGFSFGSNNSVSQGGGLFGNKSLTTTSAPSAGGLFGNNNNNNNSLNAGGTSGGLFGNNTGSTPGNSLFGNNNASSQFSFGAKPQTLATGGSLFGGNTSGMLGQQQQQQQQQNQLPQLTAMTKVADLPAPVQEELKQLDEYIQTQVSIAEYLKNQKSEHQELIISVPRDISYLEKTYASTNQALTADLKFVESFKSKTLESFNDWVEKLIKVFLQLTNPMSNSNNDQGQVQGSSKVIIGVSGNRTESPHQQQQQQQKQGQTDKNTSINITAVLNSYYIEKIEDFKDKIERYELILQEVENCVNDLDNSNVPATPEGRGGLEMVINTLQEEFKLYVELTNEFAEIHHNVSKLSGGKDSF